MGLNLTSAHLEEKLEKENRVFVNTLRKRQELQ